MERPRIEHEIRDPERNITYIVVAYRTLTQQEVVFAVRAFLTRTRRKPKKNSRIEILTVFGATDAL